MKVVVNKSYGGGYFGVSKDFCDHYNISYKRTESGMILPDEVIRRTDKRLIEYIEKFGSRKASDAANYLVVEEVPAGTRYFIENYDGLESIITEDDIEWDTAV